MIEVVGEIAVEGNVSAMRVERIINNLRDRNSRLELGGSHPVVIRAKLQIVYKGQIVRVE
jgi:hypothetical protein